MPLARRTAAARTPRRASPRAALTAAEALKHRFGRAAAADKRRWLAVLGHAELPRASDVARFHELLCFWRAYPDDRGVLAVVERQLAGFSRRPDVIRHARALANSGIAGTEIRFRFFAPTASWLARRWPDRLRADWSEIDVEALEPWLPRLAHPAEIPALDEIDLSVREWIERLKGPAETDAAFLVRRLETLPMDAMARETLYDQLDPSLILAPGPGTPSRTRARRRAAPAHWQRGELSRRRLAPGAILRLRPRAVRECAPREGARLIDLAREAMVTRSRDLDAFSYGDPRDVRVLDFGEGLEFVGIGVSPERRLLLESVYGYLTLKNGVPIGYVLTASLFGSAEIAYNVFDTFRGAEAAPIYARTLAMTRWLFGCDAFTIVPYQLGEGNDEALGSGAWWFYQKMGFVPGDRAVLAVMRAELKQMKRDPRHRSGARTLARLARANLHLFLGRPRPDVMGELWLANVGLHTSRFLAQRFGHDRERARGACAEQAATVLGGAPDRGWSAAEREAWERWAPLVLVLPGVERWSTAERRALVEVIRAKGGRRESDFVRRFDRHARLRAAVRRLAARAPAAPRRSSGAARARA